MAIDLTLVLSLLKEIRASDEINGKTFESRYDQQPIGGGFGGLVHVEVRESDRRRDQHLVFARAQRLVDFEVKTIGGKEDYFGQPVSLTPEGLRYLEENSRNWWQVQFVALRNNVITIIISVLITVLGAVALDFIGLGS